MMIKIASIITWGVFNFAKYKEAQQGQRVIRRLAGKPMEIQSFVGAGRKVGRMPADW